LKVLRPDVSTAVGHQRFLREIAVTARLDHPHIVPLLDSGAVDGLLYYVMPYVEGESLKGRISREKQLPLDDALRIAREIADALTYAHRHGIVHRDIKPDNVLLADGHARVADFGIARAISTAGGAEVTLTGIIVGTPAYMSPEQAGGEQMLDERTDVYSLACVVYELLSGQPPFVGTTPEAILARKLVEPVPSLRVVRDTIPAGVEAALVRALARVPADRFRTVGQFADALERGRETDGPTVVTKRTPRGLRRLLTGVATTLIALSVGWFAFTRTGSASPPINSLAVLPLTNFTGDSVQQPFVDAMHDALITELAQIGALTVKARQSVLRFRQTDKTSGEIARELEVDGLVGGSVYRAGDTVRVTVQLLQAQPERHVWSETFERDIRGLLSLQREVVAAIANRVEAAVTPAERERLAESRPVNPAAYQAWLRAWHEQTSASSGLSNQRCIAYAEQAIAIDSGYAPAYALAALCRIWLAFVSPTPPQDIFPRVKAGAQRAIQLDPTLGAAHATLAGAIWVYDWDWAGAERAFRRAVQLAPSDAGGHSGYAFYLASMERHEEALFHARRAEQLSAGAPADRQWVATVLLIARQYDDAIEQAQRTIDLAPGFGFAYSRLADAYEAKGQYGDAVKAWRTTVELTGGAPYQKSFLARCLARSGHRDEARRILDELITLSRTTHVQPTAFAHVYMGLGDLDTAIDWLEKGYEGRDGDMVLLNAYPAWDPLRSHPRFRRLLERMNFPRRS
ncbi:MAG: protein kinase domain-containing protein, partial [Gemmatimonadaceae bacterium]